MRARVVTDTDVALLRGVGRERSIVAASRAAGISRDRATYRLAQLGRAFGGPVVASVRGGRGHGTSRLTPLGVRIVRRGFSSVEFVVPRAFAPSGPSNRLRGTYRRLPSPGVVLDRGTRWRVAFGARDGERVTVLLDPESILLARDRFPTSARNVRRATVERVQPGGDPLSFAVSVRAGSVGLRASVTRETVRELGLARGASVWLYVKATALRRASGPTPRPTRGSLRR